MSKRTLNLKSVVGMRILLLMSCLGFCACATNPLETQSIFYGIALTAAKREEKTVCHKQLTTLVSGVDNRERWAIKLLDASGMPSGGLYWGHTHWLGSRKQCSAAGSLKQVPVSAALGPVTLESPATQPPFPVAYYAAYFRHNSTMQIFIHWKNEMRITLGLCIPASCSEAEVASLLQEYFDSNTLYQQYVYDTSMEVEGVKRTVDDFSWMRSPKFITLATTISAFLILCILGTAYDLIVYQYLVKQKMGSFKTRKNNIYLQKDDAVEDSNSNIKEKETNINHITMNPIPRGTDMVDTPTTSSKPNIALSYKLLRSFSLFTNTMRIFTVDKTKKKTLYPIHGIRFLTMVYVITGHSVLYTTDHFDNRVSAFYISDYFIIQIFTNAILSIDTYFTLSGFLLAYLFIQLENTHKDKPPLTPIQKFYFYIFGILKRFLRLTPAYMIALGIADINATWRYRSTAFWTTERNDLVCAKYWWRNILYINNFFPREEMCMSWSWYLSNDMQFFIVCSCLLILSTSYFKTAASLLGLIFVGSATYTGYVVYSLSYIPFLDIQYEKLNTLYDPPWTRIGPYIVGIVTAYIYFGLNGKLRINKYIIYVLWAMAMSLNVMTMFGLQDRNINLFTSVIYVALGRSAWAVGIAWVVFACLTGNAGAVNRILSIKIWIPLSRLTYCAYLVNPIIIYTIASYNDKGWQVEVASTLVLGTGYAALSFIAGYVMSVIFELPIVQVTRILTARSKPTPAVEKVRMNTKSVESNNETENS